MTAPRPHAESPEPPPTPAQLDEDVAIVRAAVAAVIEEAARRKAAQDAADEAA